MRSLTSEKKVIRATKLKWTFVFSMTIITLVSAFSILIYGLMVRVTAERFDESIIERAQRIERRLRIIPIPLHEEVLLGISDAAAIIASEEEFIQFITASGEIIAGVGVHVPLYGVPEEGFEDLRVPSVSDERTEHVYRAFTTALKTPGGRTNLYVRTGIDITDLRQQQRLFFVAMLLTVILSGAGAWVMGFILSSYILKPLSTNYERLKRFSLLSSHELKTPLTVIRSAADLLAADEDLTPGSQKKVTALKSAVDRIESLVSQLLLLSKSEESAFMKKSARRFKLNPMLDEIMRGYQTLAQEKGIELELRCDDTVEANTSEEFLRIIIQNLVDNAFRFTPGGGRIEIVAGYLRDKLKISVRDSGIGIRKADQKRIFERFYKAGSTRLEQSGSGLGLSIVGELAQVIGARITLTSEPGKGSEFSIVL